MTSKRAKHRHRPRLTPPAGPFYPLTHASSLPKVGAVYALVDMRASAGYIGQSNNLRGRIQHHFAALRRGAHANTKLQEAFARDGARQFVVMVLERQEDAVQRKQAEQRWYDGLPVIYHTLNNERPRGSRTDVEQAPRLTVLILPQYSASALAAEVARVLDAHFHGRNVHSDRESRFAP